MTHAKLLLVVPRDPFLNSDRVMPPLGVMYLKGYLDNQGFNVDIENNFDFNEPERYDEYTHAAISCTTPQFNEAEDIYLHLKRQNPGRQVIAGGPHATYYADECYHEFDGIVMHEGEWALHQFLTQKNLPRIITYPVGHAIKHMPRPWRTKEFLGQYEYLIDGLKSTTIMTARGCPYSCGFCEHAQTPVMAYSQERVAAEIQDIKDCGFEALMFFDDLFCMSQKRVEELCEVIDLPFRCFGHARTMTPKMAETLAKAGCREIGFGAESMDQRILDTVNKRTTPEMNEKFVEICNAAGIRVKAFLMLGLPGEDYESIRKVERFLSRYIAGTKNSFDMTIYYPYKGTPIRDNIDQYDIQIHDDGLGVYKGRGGEADCVVSTSALDSRTIQEEQIRLLRRYSCG